MSNNQNRGTEDYTKYNAMPTEQLEEILRSDAEAPADQALDGELVLYVMEVLAQRKQESEHTGKTAREAYESFRSNYMSDDQIPHRNSVKHSGGCPCWLRRLTAVAAVLAVLFVGSVAADAFGFDIWKAVVRWTQETFHFGDAGSSDTSNNLPYASLQEALEKGNTPAWLAPTRIPEGFVLADIKIEQTPQKKTYTAIYAKGKQIIHISIRDCLRIAPVYAEQGEGLVEEYTAAGITYYLFDNNGQVKAAWIVDSYECYISGHVTIEDLKMMINSIERG